MIIIILVLAALICLSGLAIAVKPAFLGGLLERHAQRVELHILAVAVRLLIGVLLLVTADMSRYPVVMHWLGWIAIVAAIVIAVMGRQQFIRLMTWALGLLDRFGRIAGLIAAVLGVFLIYAYA